MTYWKNEKSTKDETQQKILESVIILNLRVCQQSIIVSTFAHIVQIDLVKVVD